MSDDDCTVISDVEEHEREKGEDTAKIAPKLSAEHKLSNNDVVMLDDDVNCPASDKPSSSKEMSGSSSAQHVGGSSRTSCSIEPLQAAVEDDVVMLDETGPTMSTQKDGKSSATDDDDVVMSNAR